MCSKIEGAAVCLLGLGRLQRLIFGSVLVWIRPQLLRIVRERRLKREEAHPLDCRLTFLASDSGLSVALHEARGVQLRLRHVGMAHPRIHLVAPCQLLDVGKAQRLADTIFGLTEDIEPLAMQIGQLWVRSALQWLCEKNQVAFVCVVAGAIGSILVEHAFPVATSAVGERVKCSGRVPLNPDLSTLT